MHQETEIIVKAIESLKSDHNIIKDWLVPILIPFLTSLLAAAVAYCTVKHQENLHKAKDSLLIEKMKIDTVNRWTLRATQCMLNLNTIKSNYIGKLETDPIQRVIIVPALVSVGSPIQFNIEELTFIASSDYSESEKDLKTSLDIFKISALFSNFNRLLELWGLRNRYDREVKEKLREL